jgi:hypothetical protein
MPSGRALQVRSDEERRGMSISAQPQKSEPDASRSLQQLLKLRGVVRGGRRQRQLRAHAQHALWRQREGLQERL